MKMKKVRLIRDGGIRLTFMSMLTLLVCINCSAHLSKIDDSKSRLIKADSVMRTSIGDSIYRIIVDAKKIKAEEIKLTNDTTSTDNVNVINVKGKYIPLVYFSLSDPRIYVGNITTFGNFMPCFKLTFINKGEMCILNFDFGLKKWTFCDNTGKNIRMFDLSSDNMLRVANMLFPENDLYNKLINTEKR